jgi:CheY-like chemotaxis protein
MSKNGPIIVVEDDPDDQQLFSEIFDGLSYNNPVRIFQDGTEALDYLQNTEEQPFIIFCDVNLPKMNGLELRRKIVSNELLRKKSIPFVFISTSGRRELIDEAYNLTVQGYFIKKDSFPEMTDDISRICTYWTACEHPNKA